MSRRTDFVFFVNVTPEGSQEKTRLDESARILSMSYEETEKKSDMLKLKVDNRQLDNFDNPIWKTGNTVEVAWGYLGNIGPTRTVTIQKVTGATTLSVEAEGAEADMNKIPATRTFENMTRSAVVRKLAIEEGFIDDTLDIEDTEEVYEVITQSRQTNSQLFRRLAKLEGFEYYVDIDGLHFHQRRMGQKPVRSVQYYLPPDVGDVIDFNITNDLFKKPGKQPGKVTVKGRDPLKKKTVSGEGSDTQTKRDVLAPFQLVFHQRASGWSDVPTGKRGRPAQATEDVRPSAVTSNKAAKREADGAYRTAQQQAVELSLELVGDPHLVAKVVIEVRGIGKKLSGLYYIKALTSKGPPFTMSAKCITDGAQTTGADAKTGGKKPANSKANQNKGKTDKKADRGALGGTFDQQGSRWTWKRTSGGTQGKK